MSVQRMWLVLPWQGCCKISGIVSLKQSVGWRTRASFKIVVNCPRISWNFLRPFWRERFPIQSCLMFYSKWPKFCMSCTGNKLLFSSMSTTPQRPTLHNMDIFRRYVSAKARIYTHSFPSQANEFFRLVFSQLLKVGVICIDSMCCWRLQNNKHIRGALLVGILRVAKSGWLSGVNNILVRLFINSACDEIASPSRCFLWVSQASIPLLACSRRTKRERCMIDKSNYRQACLMGFMDDN